MSFKSPRKLQELAENSLLRNWPWLSLLWIISPHLSSHHCSKKACRGRYISIMLAMVRIWPFPCLPLGAMIRRKTAYRRILEIILFGLDGLLFQKFGHRRCRLKVLDLRARPLKMWNKLPVFMASDWSENQAGVGHSGAEVKPLVKVVVDLVLKEGPLDSIMSFLIQWVGQREGLMSLCCVKLQIWAMPLCHHREVLETLDLDSVQDLSVYYIYDPICLLNFSPYLGRRRYLRRLLLSGLWCICFLTPVEGQQIITQFTSQFVKLERLRSLHLDNVIFLKGHLDELFWWLQTPLETLSVTESFITKSDWTHISEFVCTSQLKHLILRWVRLTRFSPEPLRVLLLKNASTLITLDLEGCQLMDFHLTAILPALRNCTQLTRLNFLGNCSLELLEGIGITRSG